MLKRTLYFTTPMNLSLKDNQLVFWLKEAPDMKRSVPIEDIGFVVLEHPMISVTLPLLDALAQSNVSVTICNREMMPSAMLQPLESNSIQGELYRSQIDASEPLKKNLWRQSVESKIENQARLLSKVGFDGDILKPLYMNVKSGDSDNREGVAARLYWGQLFGVEFKRCREGAPPNNLLNYGYTILRAATARALVGSGLLPAMGIFHRNRYNAFPLADDVMEAYRSFVDEIVFELFYSGDTQLTKEVKAKLLGILCVDCRLDKMQRPLDVALTITTASLARCFAGKQKRITYPVLE